MSSSTSAMTSGRARPSASRNGRATGESATARRTVGRLLTKPAAPGRYTTARPSASNGATWAPSSSRMIRAARPQRASRKQEAIKRTDPLILLRPQELAGQVRHQARGRDLVDAELVVQVPPQRGVRGDRLIREGNRLPVQRAEVIRSEQPAQLRVLRQPE